MTSRRPDPRGPAGYQVGYHIRPAQPGDAELLPEIERRAAALFAGVGLAFLADGEPTPESVFAAACAEERLWVAETAAETIAEADDVAVDAAVVGFALVKELEGGWHLQEMDVLPEHGRRGLGRRLVEAAVAAARERGRRRMTLTTFRDIPWNAPFYARLGFEELPPADFTPEIRQLVAKELEAGLVPDLRCVMVRPIRHLR